MILNWGQASEYSWLLRIGARRLKRGEICEKRG
jgi:hypothetical protein